MTQIEWSTFRLILATSLSMAHAQPQWPLGQTK